MTGCRQGRAWLLGFAWGGGPRLGAEGEVRREAAKRGQVCTVLPAWPCCSNYLVQDAAVTIKCRMPTSPGQLSSVYDCATSLPLISPAAFTSHLPAVGCPQRCSTSRLMPINHTTEGGCCQPTDIAPWRIINSSSKLTAQWPVQTASPSNRSSADRCSWTADSSPSPAAKTPPPPHPRASASAGLSYAVEAGGLRLVLQLLQPHCRLR